MGVKGVDVPRGDADQGNWEQVRQSTDQARDVAASYDVHAPIGSAGRIIGLLVFPIGNGATTNLRLYKVPASPNRFKTWVLSRTPVWLFQRLSGVDTGNVNVRIGSSSGANDILLDQNVVA